MIRGAVIGSLAIGAGAACTVGSDFEPEKELKQFGIQLQLEGLESGECCDLVSEKN